MKLIREAFGSFQLAEKLGKHHCALWPRAVTGLLVDVAGHASIDQSRTPRMGNITGMFVAAEWIILAGDGDRREWQWIARVGAKGHQMLWLYRGVGDIRRRHQHGTGDLVFDLR